MKLDSQTKLPLLGGQPSKVAHDDLSYDGGSALSKTNKTEQKQAYRCFDNVGKVYKPYEIDTDFMTQQNLVYTQGDDCKSAIQELKKRMFDAEKTLEYVDPKTIPELNSADKEVYFDGKMFSAEESKMVIEEYQGRYDEYLIEKQNQYLSSLFGDQSNPKTRTTIPGQNSDGCQDCRLQTQWGSNFKICKYGSILRLVRTRTVHDPEDNSKGICETSIYSLDDDLKETQSLQALQKTNQRPQPKLLIQIIHSNIEELQNQSHSCHNDSTIQNGRYLYYFTIEKDAFGSLHTAHLKKFNMVALKESEVVSYQINKKTFPLKKGENQDCLPFRIQFASPGHELDPDMKNFHDTLLGETEFLNSLIFIVHFYSTFGGQRLMIESVRSNANFDKDLIPDHAIDGKSIKRNTFCHLQQGQTFFGVEIEDDIFIRLMTSYKVQDANHAEFYKSDAQGQKCSSKYKFELYKVTKGEVVTSSQKIVGTPRKSWSGLVSAIHDMNQAITGLDFVDYDLGFFSNQFTNDLHEKLQKQYGAVGYKPPLGNMKILKEGWTWQMSNSTTKYLVTDKDGIPYGQKSHCNYELARMFELIQKWGLCPDDKSLNQMEMKIVKDYVLNRMIVMFAFGGAPSLDKPSTHLSREEILVLHCKIKENERQEGLPDQYKSSLSSKMYKVFKNKQAVKAHIGRASNMFLTKTDMKLNTVYLFDKKNDKMKKIDVPSICQSQSIEQIFNQNVIYYFDGNGRSVEQFQEIKDECRTQTYHNWRNNTFFTFDGQKFEDYALILNPSYHPDKESKDHKNSGKNRPIIISKDTRHFVKDLKMFNLNKWAQDDEDIFEQPLMFYDQKAQQIYIVVVDLKNKEVKTTVKVNIQQQGTDFEQSNKRLEEYLATSKRLQPSSPVYDGLDQKGKQVFFKNYQLQLLYKDKGCKFIELHEFQVQWTPTGKQDRPYDNEIRQIGIMHLKFNIGDFKRDNLQLIPQFDDYNRITGTVIRIKLDEPEPGHDEFKAYYMPNEHHYQFQNDFTKSCHFKYYKKNTDKIELYFVKSKFKDESVFQTKSFHQYERSELLFQANKTVMNMVPKENMFQQSMAMNGLQSMEILDGQCIADFFLSDPQKIQDLLNIEQVDSLDHLYFKSTLKAILEESPYEDIEVTSEVLLDSGMLKYRYEPPIDLTCQTSLQRALQNDTPEAYRIAAEAIIKFMVEHDKTLANQKLLIQIFSQVLNQSHAIKYYYDFLKVFCQDMDPDCEDCNRLQMKTNLDQKIVPKYSTDKLTLRNLQLDYFGASDINDLCMKDIIDTNNTGFEYEIQNFYIDFRPLILSMKIEQYRIAVIKGNTKKPLDDKIDDFVIADLLEKNQALVGDSIKDQLVIRSIIDSQYKTTQKFFTCQGFVYISFYFAPLVFQMFSIHASDIIGCNILCLISTAVYFIVEIIQMGDMGLGYFCDFWNINDFSKFFLYVGYFILRLRNPTNQIINTTGQDNRLNEDLDLGGYTQMMSILNAILVLQAFIKTLFYLRVYEMVGQLIQLVIVSAQDAVPFMVFTVAWIFLFSIENQLLGIEIDHEEYPGFSQKVVHALQAYRNSIGDLAPPQYSTWLLHAEEAPRSSWVMIYAVWFMWLLNQYLVLIILLNFLIAVISTSYETVMQDQLIHTYNAKTAFNRESRLILSALGLQKHFDMMLISCEKETLNEDELSIMKTEIKQFVQDKFSKIDIVEQKVDKVMEMLKALTDKNVQAQ